jgi:hypothetical protein
MLHFNSFLIIHDSEAGMKRSLLLLLVVALAGTLIASAALAQQHNVTFRVNTASVPDTISATSAVYLTGATDKGDTILTNWGNGLQLDNVGGDYWEKTVSLQDGDTLHYKIKIYGGGWEENTTDGNGNRNFGVPLADTTLPVQYWNNGNFPVGKNITIYDGPFIPKPDTISIFVRVNLAGIQQNLTYGYTPADVDSVCIMGGGPSGGNLDWGTPFYLTQELPPTNSGTAFGMPAGTFFSGTLRFPKDSVTAGQDIAYKFRLGSNWSYGSTQRSEQLSDPPYGGGNRHFTIPSGLQDTTLHWVYFGDSAPIARENPDTCVITFRVSMAKAIATGGFTIGDTAQVQSGWFGTAVEVGRTRQLQQIAGSQYQYKDTIVTKIGANLDYQYYLQKLGVSTRESYYNFDYAGLVASEAERRQFTVPSGPMVGNYVTFTIYDTAATVTSPRRQPQFANQRPLAHQIRVTYTVDVRPAYYTVLSGKTLNDVQGTTNITPALADSIFKWGVWINGPAFGGWGNTGGTDWNSGLTGNPIKKMYDDGTHGDAVAGDSIYTAQIVDSPDSTNLGTRDRVGQEFKFGIRGGDNEGGSGGYGNNHFENIVDTDTAFTIASQYGSINPSFYSAWDYNKGQVATGVENQVGLPLIYSLEQNYPNPFNPSTVIEFAIPQQSNVSLKVFNVLGQEVATLVNGALNAGRHSVNFSASRFASGVYFYTIKAGNFVSTRKMLLMK